MQLFIATYLGDQQTVQMFRLNRLTDIYIHNIYIYLYINRFTCCLFGCLFVCITNVKTDELIGICSGNSHGPKKGTWTVKVEKYGLEKKVNIYYLKNALI